MLEGGLPTADPADPAVAAWWRRKADEVYGLIPDFGGVQVKADSEGEPGPFAYGRTAADGANCLAAAFGPHGGRVLWRCFVYDRGESDRCTAAQAFFGPLDGAFDPAVTLQIKHGPLDFQVREPLHPLFAALRRTSVCMELQAAQEYTGHDTHLCFLGPRWRELLNTPLDEATGETAAERIAARAGGGLCTVVNLGDHATWAGHDLAMANTFAAGRLGLDPRADPADVTREWVARTFGAGAATGEPGARFVGMMLRSADVFARYTAPLGLAMLHDCGPSARNHFDPAPELRAAYHGATCEGVGRDRVASGFAAQYPRAQAERFADPRRCPSELLLFFHHLSWAYRLADGTTVREALERELTDGAREAVELAETWRELAAVVDAERHARVAWRFAAQVAHAERWRRVLCQYFLDTQSPATEKAALVG